MKSKFRKLTAWLLTAAMLFTLMSMSTFAMVYHDHPICGAEHTDIGDHTDTCEDVKWTAVSTQAELEAMEEGESYYLDNDITLTTILPLTA